MAGRRPGPIAKVRPSARASWTSFLVKTVVIGIQTAVLRLISSGMRASIASSCLVSKDRRMFLHIL